ncbi:Na(+)/H(+) antiporter subunit B [Kitasatospora sp. NPDC056076]|uniref:Na(+)/H(+) antiporter subunit B n=1 Tax=Kitasatospora sp. NPDC056076 TaxID=3345703 RepID=UPI0035D613AC
MNGTAPVTEILILLALLLVAALGTVAALTRDPARQAVVLAVLGLGLALLFTVLQAPDVALSQLGVGTAVTPLLIMLTVRRIRSRRPPARQDGQGKGASPGEGGQP